MTEERCYSSALLREALDRLIKDLNDLIADAALLTGLHRNGDVVPWAELIRGGETALLEQMQRLQSALALANSMIEGGERHTQESRRIIDAALATGRTASPAEEEKLGE